MIIELKRGFNLVKILDMLDVNNYFKCDVICENNIPIHQFVYLSEEQNCTSSTTKKSSLFWYNEISNKSTYEILFHTAKTGAIYLTCHSDKTHKIEIDNIYVSYIEEDSQSIIYYDFNTFKNNKVYPTWNELILKDINLDLNTAFDYPLIENTYNEEEIIAMINVLLTNKLTMGKKVEEFENEFASYVGSKYAIMVNSGSSANLLAMAVATNYMRKNKLNSGDKIIVPNICWSTSVWPIVQMGLIPVFVDVDPTTMNIDINALEKLLTPDVKGIMAVHILGNCTNMEKLMHIVQQNNLFLMEDTCESLGSTYNNKMLGTFGDFGTYSFYYSHHITTIEGGMVVCNNHEDYELLKCLRAHGWTRLLKNKVNYENEYPDVDSRFLFVNVGYNFRPMETQAAMGLIQLKKLKIKNDMRVYNHNEILKCILQDRRNTNIFETPIATENSVPAWFGLVFILDEKYTPHYKTFLEHLSVHNVENRPIVTGNFARQPIFKLMGYDLTPENYPGAEILHKRGFFIGLSCNYINAEKIQKLADIFYSYFTNFAQEF